MRVHARSQAFGEHPENYARFGLKGHNGIDWYPTDGGRNHKVRPTEVGTVSKVYIMDSGWGNAVRLRHSWGESIYAHFLNTPLVKLGQSVDLNTVLGIEDSTGNSTGTHLHFGVYPTGVSTSNGYSGAVNPEEVGFYPYSPPIVEPTVPTQPLKPGLVKVIPFVGLKVRSNPTTMATSYLATIPYGSQFTISDETKIEGNIVWRRAILWVAESENGEYYLKNV